MKNYTAFCIVLSLLLFSATKSFANTYYSRVNNGNWNTNTTWSTTSGGGAVGAGIYPLAGDNVIIEKGYTVVVNGAYSCTSLQIGSPNTTSGLAGTLTFSGTTSSLTVSGTVTVGGYGNTNRTGTILFVSGSTLTAGSVIVGGSGTNSAVGLITFVSGSTLSAGSVTLGGTGTTPTTGTITMVSGSTMTTGSLAVGAGGTWTPGTGSATVQLNASNTLPSTVFTTFNNLKIINGTTISSGVALTTDTVTVSSPSTLLFEARNANYTINGDLIVPSGGTFKHTVDWDTTGFLLAVGGNVSIDGIYNYTAPRCHLQMTGTGKTIRSGTTSGSAFSIVTIMTGAITASGTVTINDNFWAPFNNTGSFSTSTYTVNANAGLFNAGGTLNINGGTLNISGGLYVGFSVSSGTTNLSSGILNADFVTVGDTVTTFSPTTFYSEKGTFNQTGGTANIGNLTITNTTTASAYTCTGTPTINISGNWANNGTFTAASSTTTFDGAAAQALGGNNSSTFYNLTMNNASSNITLGDNITVNNTLNLTNGEIITGANNVIIPTTGSVTNATSASYIDGTIEKYIASGTTSKTFEVGDANYYTPVTLAFGGVNNSTGYISANTTGTDHPQIASSSINPASDVNRYWTLTNTGVTFTAGKTYSPTFTFINPGDLDAGATPASFILNEYSGSAWTAPTVGTLTTTSSQATGLTSAQFGDFAIGNTVVAAATTSTVSSSLNPSCSGSSVTFTGTVTSGGSPVTAGTVTFYDGVTAIGSNITLNTSGQATYSTTTLTSGNHSITAVYNGVPAFATSTSSILTETINSAVPASPGTISGTQSVCPGITSLAYSIAAVTNASTYTWSVPTGWSITAGQGTTSITATAGSYGQNGNIAVTAGNGCGTSTGTQTINISPTVSTNYTGYTSNTTKTSGNITVSYTTDRGYLKFDLSSIPTGATINSSTLNLTNNGSGALSAVTNNITALGTNDPVTTTAATLYTAIGSGTSYNAGTWNNTGTIALALNTSATTDIQNGISSPGYIAMGLLRGNGTSTYDFYGYAGTTPPALSVTYTAVSTLAVITNPGTPATPGTITGTAIPCGSTAGLTYSITAVTNATTYTWTVPTGWAITAGQGTTSITVTAGSSGQNGNISVTAGNSCGTSTANTLAVSVTSGTPVTPGTVSPSATMICPSTTGLTYSIAAVTNATTYTWSVPTGWSITAGQGTTSITVTAGVYGQNGNIGVTAGNSCGTSTANTLAVSVSPGTPSTPGTITGTTATCPGTTSLTYSITAITNATTYAWTIPTGWTITAGQGTTSLTVTAGTSGQNGNISVTAGNSCGTSTANSLAVIVNTGTLATPGTITGTTATCPSTSGLIYSITAITGATTYTWAVPTGWTITAGQGTVSITVTSGTSGQNGNISVTAGDPCITSAAKTLAVTVNPGTPATPGTITGTATTCPGTTALTYSITAVTNATTYTWSVPTGWTITAGQGTTLLTVTAGAYGQNGNISVTAGNSCGTSAANIFPVTVTATPATPGTITGTASTCPVTSGQTYSIASVTNATTYTWSVPTGWIITGGQGTTSLTVTTGASGQNGNISVTAGDICGTSAAKTLAVVVNTSTLATPGTITGTTAVCPGITTLTYSIAAITGATTYTWTAPTGWAITSGQGTTSVTVTSGAYGQNGNISVTAGNPCVTSTANTLAVTINPGTPATPSTITGTAVTCPSTTSLTYSIAAVTNATTYTWAVPTGWTITAGQGTTSMTATAGTSGQNGNVSITAGNSCGTSTAKTFAVTVNPGTPATPGTITGTTSNCPSITGLIYSISSVTNATTYTWTVPTGWTITAGQGTNSITVTSGTAGQNGNISVTAGNSCGTSASKTLAVTVNAAPTVTITPNYCYGGGQVQLTASSATSYSWSTGETTQSILVDLAGTYSVTVTNASGCTAQTSYAVATELVSNGSFTQGNTGFTTLYTYTTAANGLEPEGYYAVGPNANYYHPNFYGTDHTNPGTGNFMIVNGGPSLQTIWQQGITIVPNTTYYFSAWAMSMNNVSPYAQLQFAINGTNVGTTAVLPAGASSTAGPFTWTQFYGTWNSGSLTSATLSIIDLQTAAGGNDFGLDDISFSTLSPIGMTAAPAGNEGSPLCATDTLNLAANVTGGTYPLTYAWTGPSFSSSSSNPSISNASSANSGTYKLTVTDGYGCTVIDSTTVKVNALPVMTSATAKTICSASSVGLTLTSDSASTYTWIAASNANIGGESTTTQSTGTINNTLTNSTISTQNVIYTVTPTSTGGGCTGAAQTVTVTVNPLPAITAQPSTAAQTVCAGSAITALSITATGAGLTYQWYYNATNSNSGGTAVSTGTGYTTATFTPSNSVASTYYYYCIVSGTCTPPVTSNVSGLITVRGLPVITAQPSTTTQTICAGSAITALSVTATGTGLTYQWYYNATNSNSGGTAVSTGTGYTTATFTPSNSVASTYYYYCVVSGTCTPPATSNVSGLITVNGLPAITAQPSIAAQTVCAGSAITALSITATGAGLTYQWYYNATNSNSGGTTVSTGTGYTTATFTPSNSVASTYYYYCKVSGTCTPPVTSNVSGLITVNGLPAITIQPSTGAQTICAGSTITALSVTATGTALTYQWYYNATNSNSGGTAVSTGTGYTTATFTPSNSVASTYYYYCVVSGTCTPPATSNVSGLITVNGLPAITAQPSTATQTVCAGSTITALSVTATGTALTYQWYYNATNSNSGGTAVSTGTGYTTATFTPSNSVASTYYYYCIVSGTCTPPFTSNVSGLITVRGLPVITTQPSIGAQTICAGSAITALSVTATGTGLTYQWYYNATNSNSGGTAVSTGTGYTTATFTPSNSVASTYYYYCVVSGTCTPPATSNVSGLITVRGLPAITAQPSTAVQSVCAGSAITALSVTATGTTLTYQWYYNTTSSNSGGTAVSTGTGYTTATFTPSNSIASAYYYYCIVSGTCTPPVTSNVSGLITVNLTPTLTSISALPICANNTTTVNLTGLVAGSINTVSYSINGVAQTPVSAVTANGSGNASFTSAVLTVANNGQFLVVTGINNSSCSVSFSKSTTLAVTASGTWLGFNTDWNNPINWCGGIPTSATDVLIPSGLPYYPYIDTSISSKAHNLTIQSGASIILKSDTMQVYGTINNSGVFDATLGSIEMSGSSAQTIYGSSFSTKTILNLIINNTSGVSLSTVTNDTLNISGAISFGNVNNTTFNTNNNLTLLSNATSTAMIADITNNGVNSGNTIAGKTIVQRFVPAHRAWRLMAAPVSATGAPTISAAWQEGAVDTYLGERVNPNPGFGAHITGGPTRNVSGVGNTSGNGFDAGPNQTSIYSYVAGTGWSIPANTSSTLITANSGYMLFVRGDRSTNLALGVAAPTTTTILRPAGQLNIGTQSYNFSGPTGFHLIGNPFASTISYSSLSALNSNTSTYYYVMDPLMTGSYGVGSFITLTPNGAGGYSAIPDPSISTPSNNNPHAIDTTGAIQSGASFFIYSNATTSSLTVREQDKVAGSNTYLFRPAGNPAPIQQLRATMYSPDGTGANNMLDGVLDQFNANFSDSLDFMEDVKKIGNPEENLSLIRNGIYLAAENRQPIVATDTIFYTISSLEHTSYILELVATNLNQSGLTGILKDSYTGTSTPLDMNGVTTINFAIDGNAASKAVNRFMVVFQPLSIVPVTFTSVKATQQSSGIAVQWQVENESNIKQYEVEKSTNGIDFVTVGTVAATGNNKSSVTYNWLDTNPANGENYYRIASVDNNGAIEYTQIVSVNINSGKSSIAVYPNPSTGGVINLQMNNMPEGTYNVRLLNSLGQIMLTKEINHPQGSSTETITYDRSIAKEAYTLEVINPDNSKTSTTLVIN